MTEFEKLLAKMNKSVTEAYGENIVQNGDFSTHQLTGSKRWGTMEDTGDGSWVAESGKIEVQKSTGHNGTPAKKVKSTVLELDALTGRKGLGATESNATVSQMIEEIDGPGTYRLSLDFMARGKGQLGADETGTGEVWVGDKLVAVLSQDKTKWEERIIEFTLDEDDIPEGGVELKLKATGKADGRGATVDNISLREIGETGLLGEELVTNGDFETNPSTNGRGVFHEIEGWSVSDDSVLELRSVRKPITPRDKDDTYIELDSHGADSNSTVVQEIEVPADGTYLLAFDYSARAARGKDAAATSPIKVMVGDEVIAEITADEAGWKPFTFNVDLAKGPVKLSFEGTGVEDKVGGLLDNIELRKVAELGPDADPINAPEPVAPASDETAETVETAEASYKSGLLGEVHFADDVLKKMDQALEHIDDTPDATFVATEIDYGNKTGWFHTPLDLVLEHDAESLVGHSEGALEQNVNHTVMQLTGEVYLEAGSHKFFNRTDDGFRLTIDDQEIAEYQGIRAARNTTGEIEIEEDGWYPIQIDYFEWKGHSKLRVEHQKDGGPREILDEDMLRHEVEPDNLGPDAIDDSAEGAEDTAIVIDALGNDSDPDGDAVFILDATDGANGTVTFTPPVVEEVANTEGPTLGENLIVNGDFEDNPLNGRVGWGHWDTIEGWESPVGRIEVQTKNYNTGNTKGNAVVELDSHGRDSNATLQQEVEIEEAGTYQFSLDYAMRGKHAWTNGVGVRINGETVHEVIKPKEQGFQTLTLDVELDPGTAVIEIYALGKQDTIGTVIDNVSLRQVQESDPVRVFKAPDGGLITYTPEPGFVGEDTFTYTISDGNGGTDTATVTVVVAADNEAPIAVDDQIQAQEDQPIVLDLLGNDRDPDGDALTITEVGPVENGTLSQNEDGTFTFTPDENFHGTVTFDYTVTDGEFLDTATVTIDVAPVNDAVMGIIDHIEMDEDTTISLDLLSNDIDVDGDALSIVSFSSVDNGEIIENADGTYSFRADADFNGRVTFQYTVTDGIAEDTTSVIIDVVPIDDPVEAVNDLFTTDEDVAVTFDLLANDLDVDGDTLSLVSLGTVDRGTLELNADGTVTYTPLADDNGFVSFQYTMTDGETESTATARIEILPINDRMVAMDDVASTEAQAPVTIDVLANDVDIDGDVLEVTSVSGVTDGTATINADGTITFIADEGFEGETSFAYSVSDGTVSTMATVTIDVAPLNRPPEPEDDIVTVAEDGSVTIDFLANDIDLDGDTLSVVEFGLVRNGLLTENDDGTVTFTPNADYNGNVTISYTVSDDEGLEGTARMRIEVTPVNDAAVTVEDFAEVRRDSTVQVDVLRNDSDVDGDDLELVSATSARGEITIVDGELFYDPSGDFDELAVDTSDIEVITYTVRDAGGVETTGTLYLTVLASRKDPVRETLNFRETGTNGSTDDLDAGSPVIDIADVSVSGLDNNDRIGIDLLARGGNGRSSSFGERGEDGDDANGTDGTNAVDVGGAGGDATAILTGASLNGGEFNDDLNIEVEARAGRSGKGGDGGAGGAGSPLGSHLLRRFDGSEVFTDYGDGPVRVGGDGGNGVAGGAGAHGVARLEDGVFDGGLDDDDIVVEVLATGGDGGNGGNGGQAGLSGNDRPLGGNHVNTTRAGDGARGGDGGDARAEAIGNQLLGGQGEDDIRLIVEAEAGQGGNGGIGRDGGKAQFLDTTLIDNGLFAPATYEGEVHELVGIAGDGGDAGDNGDADVVVRDNLLSGGEGNDELLLEVIVATPDVVLGTSGGSGGVDATLTPEETGTYTIHQTAGVDGADGADGAAGAVRVEVDGNTIDGGEGDDLIEIIFDLTSLDTLELIVTNNSIDGGAGFDTVDFSEVDASITVDLGSGVFGIGDGAAANNAIAGIESLIATEFDDTVVGGSGSQTLEGGDGNDVLSGGGGLDTFIYKLGDGADEITDFSNDRLDFSKYVGVSSTTDLAITDTADGALISTVAGDSILLRGVAVSEIDEDAFVF
ncbi:MAG: Ig-like domain-containing protein [Pseudomonadota bacterium]